MQSRLIVLVLLFAATLSGAGGLSFDGATDFLDCGVVSFSTTVDYINIAAYVSPGFASTDATNYFILDNNNFGANQGYSLIWRGASLGFRMTGGGTAFNRFCEANPTFAAGDILGLYFSIADNVQNCEVWNLSNTAGSDNGSSFDGWQHGSSGNNLIIGADVTAAANFWLGTIYSIVFTNNRIKNTNFSQLPAAKKSFFLYMWPGNPPTQVYTTIDYVAAWDFASGNDGDTPVDVLDVQQGNTCTVNGAPVAVSSPLIN